LSLTIGTDFSGIGSPEEALRMAKIKHRSVFACEKDSFARTTFEANNETEHFYRDITDRNQEETPEVDLYVAGFPCQAFSLAGKQLGFEDVRGTLFFNSADYIRAKRPKVFILENVKGLLSHDKVDKKSKYGRTFNTIINLLARTVNGQEQLPFYQDNLGYNVYHAVLNTKEHGIPQNRERIFIVGIRPDVDNNTFRFPSKEPLLLRLKDILEKEVDEHYYLSDKMLEYLFGRSKNFNSGKINFKGSEDIASAITCASASLDVSDNILVENVGNVNPSGIGMNGQVFHSNGLSPTITTNKGEGIKVLVENDVLICKPTRTEEGKAHRREAMRNGKDHTPFQAKELRFEASDVMNAVTCATQKDNLIAVSNPDSTPTPTIIRVPNPYNGLPDEQVRCCAMRGRGEGWQQELEVRQDDVTNTLTAVQKDNLILIGNVSDKDHQAPRVYNPEGISCTIQSEGGGQGAKTGLYLVENSQTPIIVPNNTQKGYSEAKEGDSINMKYLKSKTAGSMVKQGIASTLDHNCNQAVVVQNPEIWDLFGNTENLGRVSNPSKVDERNPIAVKGDLLTRNNPERQNGFSDETMFCLRGAVEHGVIVNDPTPNTQHIKPNYRIRKLTPLECFRLQGFSDAFYYRSKAESEERSKEILAKNPNHKGKRQFTFGERIERMSDSQLYKQAGNSITTRVIMKVILNLKGILNFEYDE
jgi:DNA-cytosine methyltransferase